MIWMILLIDTTTKMLIGDLEYFYVSSFVDVLYIECKDDSINAM